MKSLSGIIQPLHHCEDAALYLLRLLGVKITFSTLQKDLTEHPNYPSMLAISDVVKTYGVYTIAARLEREEWNNNLVPPFLAHVKSRDLHHDVFAVVTSFSETQIEIYNPEIKKVQRIDNNEFIKNYYHGTIMAVEAKENAREQDYEHNIKKDKRKYLFYLFSILLLPMLTILTSFILIYNNPTKSVIAPVIYTFLTLLGVIAGTLLLWHELDEYNPVVKQICQSGKKVNCSAILNSKAAKIWGTSWSTIGLTYFLGTLIVLLTGGLFSAPIITIISWVNILALPYVIFSVFYQWKVAKQWCILCLSVQAILILQFVNSLTAGFPGLTHFDQIPAQSYLTVTAIGIIVFIGISILLPALQKAKSNRAKTIELQRLKHNPQIFEALLGKQRSIQPSNTQLGIRMGNSKGKYKVIKVCNPYCGPCAKAHPVLEGLLEYSDEVDLQIIFTATNEENDIKKDPVLHLLAIAAKGDPIVLKQALDDWYGAAEKNYTEFAKKYPMNGELEKQREKVEAMKDWCETTKIDFTPTLFVNGRQLPEMYSVSDLKYFLID
jgi:uncharacterized membrane protein/thiol-disulfide isomerase/thioredoxin